MAPRNSDERLAALMLRRERRRRDLKIIGDRIYKVLEPFENLIHTRGSFNSAKFDPAARYHKELLGEDSVDGLIDSAMEMIEDLKSVRAEIESIEKGFYPSG